MIARQEARIVFERDQSRRRQHAGLPHAAAQPFAIEPRPRDVFRVPASIDPTGAPSAFDRQNITVSTGATISRTRMPNACAALKTRAPSM